VILANLSDALEAGVVIIGDTGCIGIVGELYSDQEVFVDRVLFERGENVGICDEDITDDINPEWSDHEWGQKPGSSNRLIG
jgi:hypothetical protein